METLVGTVIKKYQELIRNQSLVGVEEVLADLISIQTYLESGEARGFEEEG